MKERLVIIFPLTMTRLRTQKIVDGFRKSRMGSMSIMKKLKLGEKLEMCKKQIEIIDISKYS